MRTLALDIGGTEFTIALFEGDRMVRHGAGDRFSAAASVALAATGSVHEPAQFGNLVASIAILKRGTGTASPAEVREAAGRGI